MGAAETRRRIVETADELFYAKGFEATSFSDIAAAVGLSRGNFYYHFQTKDEILGAVIERRLANVRDMLEGFAGENRSPAERIRAFAHILVRNRAKIMAYGCPVGTLCNELAKLDHIARDEAAKPFEMFRAWLAREFAALGRAAEADRLALHLLMRTQGVATLALALRDEAFLDREVADLDAWIDAQDGPGAPSHIG